MTPLPIVVQTFKALANPARLRIIAMLRPGELCGCQIAAVLDLSPSTVSAHLAELRRGGLIAERKEGRWVHYRLSDGPEAKPVLDQVWTRVRTDATVRADAAVLRRLRTVDVAELCRLDLDLRELGITRPTLHATGARG
jgi:ArsR family transcriptional regulator, arsenate/arsenite/antimonite-responsive transcriptional repressor